MQSKHAKKESGERKQISLRRKRIAAEVQVSLKGKSGVSFSFHWFVSDGICNVLPVVQVDQGIQARCAAATEQGCTQVNTSSPRRQALQLFVSVLLGFSSVHSSSRSGPSSTKLQKNGSVPFQF